MAGGLAALMAPGALASGLELIGGRRSAKEVRKMREAELAAQKEFAQHGVRWRVEDAKAAGLHPLYALGAQTPSFSPSFQVGGQEGAALAAAGQHLSRGMVTRAERELGQLQLDLAKKQLDEADARIGALNSEAYRNMQEGLSMGTMPTVGEPELPSTVPEGQAPRVGLGMTTVEPTSTPTRSADASYLQAGSVAGLREFEFPGGVKVLLPATSSGDASEAIEALESPLTMGAVLLANVLHYADNGKAFFRMLDLTGGPVTPARREAARRSVRGYRRSGGAGGPRGRGYKTGGGF